MSITFLHFNMLINYLQLYIYIICRADSIFNTLKCFYYYILRHKVQWLAFMYKVLNGQVAVPAASVDLILSSRPSRGTDANQQKLITVRSYTENYRQSHSIRTVTDWNSLPQSVASAGSLALFKSRLTSHVALWLNSPSVWCPSQGPCRLTIQIQIDLIWVPVHFTAASILYSIRWFYL